jgi:hypothetical protein
MGTIAIPKNIRGDWTQAQAYYRSRSSRACFGQQLRPSKISKTPTGNYMVGWGFAFGRGLVILLWTIVWAIVGAIIAVVISGGTLAAFASNPTAIATNPFALIGSFFLGFFLATLVAIVGMYASIVKVAVDGALKQMESSGFAARPTVASFGTQPTLTTAPNPVIKYCKNCGTSIPTGSAKCPSCGATFY